jgi:hypothetical protein
MVFFVCHAFHCTRSRAVSPSHYQENAYRTSNSTYERLGSFCRDTNWVSDYSAEKELSMHFIANTITTPTTTPVPEIEPYDDDELDDLFDRLEHGEDEKPPEDSFT